MRTLLIALAAFVAAAGTAAAADAPEISSNWAGYAAVAPAGGTPVAFTDVTATWRQPKATCTSGRPSSSAFWVGLGGYDPASTSLEQLGTAADCGGSATTATNYAWWELVPAAAVKIPLRIAPGDTITAAVLVNGQTITFSLKDVTQKTRFSKVVHATQALDTASAEWIAEAPSQCTTSGRCRTVPLTNFGSVAFSKIAAIGNGHAGTLTDPLWTPAQIELIANGRGDRFFGGDVLGPGVGAVPGDATADGRSFSVTWQQNLTP